MSWAVSCSQGWVVLYLSLEHKGPDASSCPHVVIFSSAPGGRLFSQEPGWALSVVSETKVLTYTLLAWLITFYLKLKFSYSWVPYRFQLYNSTIHHLYIILCVHHPESSLHPSPFIPPYSLLPPPSPFPTGNHNTVVCVYEVLGGFA